MNRNFWLAIGLALTGIPGLCAAADYGMKPYPPAEPGMQRLVFRAPAIEQEDARKVEVLAGKVLEVDCNKVALGGALRKEVAQGWGFPYYVLEVSDRAASTLMACPPDEPKTREFVAVGGEGFLLRYNSKLPVVVYAPEGFEVRYRIWTAGEMAGVAAPE